MRKAYKRASSLNSGLCSAAMIGCLLVAGHAQAQQTEPAKAGNVGATAQDAASGVSDIIVTAQRRAENLQDVPIAVTALGSQALSGAGADSIRDLQSVTPGLTGYQVGPSFLPFIRGVGSSLSQAGFDSSVAIYVDGIYQADKGGNLFELANLERVEILKGPQGTLFGRNATGGAINIITKDPGKDATMSAEAGYGRFDEKRVRFYGSAPITDSLSVNLGVARRWDHGYVRDVNSGARLARVDKSSISAKLLWEPTDALSARLSYLHTFDSDNTPGANRPRVGTVPISSVAPYNIPIPSGLSEVQLSFIPVYKNKHDAITLDTRYELGQIKLTSLTGYRKGTGAAIADGDSSAANISYNGAGYKSRQFSQEFQISGDITDNLDAIGGLYYIYDKQGYGPGPDVPYLVITSGLPYPFTAADLVSTGRSVTGFTTQTTTRAKAIFAQATYHLTDSDRLTAGLRYSTERKSLSGEQIRITGVNSASGAQLVETTTLDIAALGKAARFSRITWRLAYDHRFTQDIMAYVSYNRGFKSGSFNPSTPTRPVVEPEVLDAFEVGAKSKLFDGLLRLNAAAYYYDYKNIQVAITAFGTSGTAITENAAAARIYGFDVDFEAVPVPSLTIRGGLAVINSRYKSYPEASVAVPNVNTLGVLTGGNTNRSVDYGGRDVLFAPPVSANLGFDYDWSVGQGRILFSGNVFYTDGYNVAPGGPQVRINAYETVNASATWFAPGDRYYVKLWGQNLTNDRHIVYLAAGNASTQTTYAKPVTYGMSVGFKL